MAEASRNMDSQEIDSTIPKDVQVIGTILKEMGIVDYEPRVINQLLEFTYKYITDVLDDSKCYATHAGRSNVSLDDVKLAIQTKLTHSFVTPPAKEYLLEVAQQKNNSNLPSLKTYTGARLPPDRYCLSSVNYKLKKDESRKKSNNALHRTPSSSYYTQQQPQMMLNNNGAMKRKWQEPPDHGI